MPVNTGERIEKNAASLPRAARTKICESDTQKDSKDGLFMTTRTLISNCPKFKPYTVKNIDPVDGMFFGFNALIKGLSKRFFIDDFVTNVFTEITNEELSCKNAPGRPMKEESDNQRVDSMADLPARLVTD